jgi:hypothetical protein
MAVWTIPQLAEILSSGVTGAGAELADPLLRILNGGVEFSLYAALEVTFNLMVIVIIAMGFHFKAALAAAR